MVINVLRKPVLIGPIESDIVKVRDMSEKATENKVYYLVRGYSPSMHFFWRGEMPYFSPPLPFQRGRAGCSCVLEHGRPPNPRGGRAVHFTAGLSGDLLRSEKNRSSNNVQNGQNFGLALNIGSAFSDRFQVLIAI